VQTAISGQKPAISFTLIRCLRAFWYLQRQRWAEVIKSAGATSEQGIASSLHVVVRISWEIEMHNVQCKTRVSTGNRGDGDKRCWFARLVTAAEMILVSSAVALVFSMQATASSIYAIRPNGEMVYYRYAGVADGSVKWAVEQKVIGSGWQGLEHVLAGDNGAIYAIRPDGQMLFYRYAGMADGSFKWAVEQKVIGSGWQGFKHVLAGDNGAIYAIRPDGQMLFYRYAGMADGSFKWAVEQKVIGSGWQGFEHVVGGYNGAIYGIQRDGQMLFYRYAGMADGSFKWAVEQKVIGSGWQDFSTVAAGDNGAIYAIRPDGQMLFYRYAGMADGSLKWAVEQKVIGSGWAFRQVIVGGGLRTAAAPLPPSISPAPSAPSVQRVQRTNPRCAQYARSAITDFQLADRLPKCAKPMKRDNPGRWHAQFEKHYDWCMTVSQAALKSEADQRNKLLMNCGGRANY